MDNTAHRLASGPANKRHPTPRLRTGFDSWAEGVDKADDQWNAYDCEIRSAVNEYNMHLSRTPGYVPLDWQVVKAMLWVETGAKALAWKSRPMQIGHIEDAGLMALLGDREGGDLVVPPSLRVSLSASSVRAEPVPNIRAGIGYLLMRMATFEFKSLLNADDKVYEVTVKDGDSLERIARAQGSTPEVMKKLNPSAHLLKAGQVLKYQKAAVRKVITGWMPLTPSRIATRYNVGDPDYARKMDHALPAVRKAKEAVCR
ncbi:LysM peptidoglycan-binding domain-containing protein [Variovorax boronicumulans]